MSETVFLSYGGPDEPVVQQLNQALQERGVTTWFFPNDALPGQKLHRVMHDGVNKYDRVLLVCSSSSLSRPGVLNEIERVLEREAREGGSDRLIPITIDRFVYSDWTPEREDIAEQIRGRVITSVDISSEEFDFQLEKIVKALAEC